MAEGRSADLYSPSDWESRSEQRWKEGGIPDYQVRHGMIRIEPGRKAKVSILLSRKRRDWREGEKEKGEKTGIDPNLQVMLYIPLGKEKKESYWKRIKGNVKGLADNHKASVITCLKILGMFVQYSVHEKRILISRFLKTKKMRPRNSWVKLEH